MRGREGPPRSAGWDGPQGGPRRSPPPPEPPRGLTGASPGEKRGLLGALPGPFGARRRRLRPSRGLDRSFLGRTGAFLGLTGALKAFTGESPPGAPGLGWNLGPISAETAAKSELFLLFSYFVFYFIFYLTAALCPFWFFFCFFFNNLIFLKFFFLGFGSSRG